MALNAGSYATEAPEDADTGKGKKGKTNLIPASPAALEAGKKFRVVHAAVGGVGKDRKGQAVERDYYAGAIVTPDMIDNNDAYYIALGAIEEVK